MRVLRVTKYVLYCLNLVPWKSNRRNSNLSCSLSSSIFFMNLQVTGDKRGSVDISCAANPEAIFPQTV